MCFTIEPGLYNENHFGVRLENSCYMKDNKIHSFVKMNYEKKLIDYSLLNKQEKEWLNEFEVLQMEITSVNNELVKETVKLQQKKYRDKKFLLEGEKCVEEAFQAGIEILYAFVLKEKCEKFS